MKALSKEQVEFIDRYLKKSGIQYVDVRLELTDHVASELERKINKEKINFRAAFKDYMAAHKRELLKSKRSFMWAMDKKVLLGTLRNFKKPLVLMIAVILFFSYRQLDFIDLADPKGVWLKVVLVYALLMLAVFSIAKYRTFLGMQRVATYWNLLLGLPMLVFKPHMAFFSLGDQIFVAYIILMNAALFYTGIKMHRNYRKNHQLS